MSRTPLLLASIRSHKKLVELLLRRDADPRSIDAKGLTAMHFICKGNCRSQRELERAVECATLLLEIGKEKNQSVQINARDRSGNTPLHYALAYSDKRMIELLLRNGADFNLANAEGLTALHFMCKNFYKGGELVETLFKISEESHRTVRVNARDIKGNTPLHLALQSRIIDIAKTSELLLRNGADFNLANAEGLTALHFMCKNCKIGHDLVDMIFRISEENHQAVRVNATDKLGNTPLYYAVAPIHSDCGIYWIRPIVQTLLKNDETRI
ncbi:tankyrase-2-like [Trichogramma pretiosum]|uniref:tankyrase-2-like n=1 Tax=Trichogramma pretiosum TaxID=7493 RepID=UPI0006C9C530|nr:tankyrase-2-like [Trichogramma pretiosum]